MSNMEQAAPLVAAAHTYVTGRYRRGEIGAPARDAITYTLATLAEVHGRRPVSQLGPAIIDRWMETHAHLAPSTRRNMVSRVRTFCRWLQAQGKIRRDPTAHIPSIRVPHREPVTFSRPEVLAVVAALPDLRARLIVGIMDDVAARCADVALLRVEDYDPVRLTLLLRAKNHERRPPIAPATARLIEAYLSETGHSSGPLIRQRTEPHLGLSPATISRYVNRWVSEAGVKRRPLDGRSAHAFRRTCLSELMEACGDVQLVQEVAGHVRPDTTIRSYLRPVSTERVRAAMALRQQAA
jgi:integrase